MILTLPKLLTLKNRAIKALDHKSSIIRGVVVIFLTAFLIYLTYYGAYSVLKLVNSQPGFFYVPPAMPLGSILTFLFYMLIFTNTISAIGSLYFSNELSLILSSPIQGYKFYQGKLLDTLFSSSWMTIVFLLPVMYAFGAFYQAQLDYYLLLAILLIPYFIVPAAISMVLATISILLIPVRLRKEAMLLSVCLFLYAIYCLLSFSTASISPENGFDAADLAKLVQAFSAANQPWLLPNLIALALGEILAPQLINVSQIIVIAYLISIASLSFSYLFLSFFYQRCYYRANILYNIKRVRLGGIFSKFLSRFLSKKFHALIDKEIKIVTRDLTQSVQLLMLLGICALYIYSLSIQSFFIEKSPEHQIRWWKSFFLVLNICVESFVITALSSRFAFSAVSREGRAFWVIQVAPLEIGELLKAKFIVWFSFIYFISAIVFGAASWIYFENFQIVLMKIFGLFVINLGLVSLAIGTGAYFAKFDWEHISQVATSFGNLIYMLLAVALVMFDVMMEFLFLVTYSSLGFNSSVFLLVLIVINLLVVRYSLAAGARKLAIPIALS